MRRMILALPFVLLAGCVGTGRNIDFKQAQKWHSQNSDRLTVLLGQIAKCRPIIRDNDEDVYISVSNENASKCANNQNISDIQKELKDLKLIGAETHRVGNIYRVKFVFYTNSYWTTDEVTSVAYEPLDQKFQDSDTDLRALDSPPSKWFWSRYAGG